MDNENVVKPAPAKQKMLPIIRYAILAVIGIVALALVINIIVALIPDKFKLADANNIVWEENDDDQMVFLFNGKNVVEVDDDITKEMLTDSIMKDYNSEYAVFMTEGKTNDKDEYTPGDLYVVNKKKAVKAADEVDSYVLSAFGDTFVYITEGDLYYGQLKNANKATKIDTDVDYISAISPDGKAFAYAKVDEKDEEVETDFYICTNGKKGEKFGKKESEIVALGNGAKYVYYTKDGKFCVNDSKLADVEDVTGMVFMFNRDGSQLIYNSKNDDGEVKAYLSSKATEKNSFGNGTIAGLVCPEGSMNYSMVDEGVYVYYNTSSFAKTAVCLQEINTEKMSVEDNYYYLKNVKGDSEKITSLKDADNAYMLDDGKTVLYTKKGYLRSINITKPASEPVEYSGAEDDIYDFDCTVDGKHIYTRDTDGTLYYVKSKTSMKKVKYDVVSYEVLENGKVYFVNDDFDLFFANKAPTNKKVASDVDYDSLYYDIRSGVATVEVDGAFGILKGAKFNKLFSLD